MIKTLLEIGQFFKTKDIHLVKMIDDSRAIFTDGYLYFTVLICDDFGRQRWFSHVTYIDKMLNEFQFPPLK